MFQALEFNLYGDRSANLAKTYKVIGTLQIIQNNHIEARIYLQKAAAIFEQRGMVKMLKEVKQKLKLLMSQNNTALMQSAAAEFQNVNAAASDEDIDGGASVGTNMQKR